MIYGSYSMDVSVAYHSDGCKPEDSGNHAADSSHKAGREKKSKTEQLILQPSLFK